MTATLAFNELMWWLIQTLENDSFKAYTPFILKPVADLQSESNDWFPCHTNMN